MQHMTILPVRTRGDAIRDVQAALSADHRSRRVSALIAALKVEIANPDLVEVLDAVQAIHDLPSEGGHWEAAERLASCARDVSHDFTAE